jgi:hypothetical protein
MSRHSLLAETLNEALSYGEPIGSPDVDSEPTGRDHMKPSVMLTVASLLSILLLSLHIAEDIVLGFSGGGLTNLVGIAILVVYLCGALLLSDRRSGLIIVLVGSLLAVVVPIIHMTGAGVGVKRSADAFFFVWTLYALGVIGTFGVILSVRALRGARAVQSLPPESRRRSAT